MNKPEFTLEQIENFDKKGFPSVAARMLRSLLLIFKSKPQISHCKTLVRLYTQDGTFSFWQETKEEAQRLEMFIKSKNLGSTDVYFEE